VIEANVIKGIHEMLGEHGPQPAPGERLSDYVARALNISGAQAEVLLAALHDGATPEEAAAKAGINPVTADLDLLTRMAQAIGTALGEVKRRV
jgi:hypothetical protein